MFWIFFSRNFGRDTVREQLDLSEITQPYKEEERDTRLPPGDDGGTAVVCVLPWGVLAAGHRPSVGKPSGLHGGDRIEPSGLPHGE